MLSTGISGCAKWGAPASGRLNRHRLPLATLVGALVMAGAGQVCVAPSMAATVAVPAGNLVPNSSFEGTSLTGWSSWQGAVSRVALASAPDATHVARTARSTSNAYSLELNPLVRNTTAGVSYVTAGYVAAAATSSVGKTIQLVARERTAAGAAVASTGSVSVSLTRTFRRLSVTAKMRHSGDRLDLYIWQAGAVTGNAFYADSVTDADAATPGADSHPDPAPRRRRPPRRRRLPRLRRRRLPRRRRTPLRRRLRLPPQPQPGTAVPSPATGAT